jgi:hypothetical protein
MLAFSNEKYFIQIFQNLKVIILNKKILFFVLFFGEVYSTFLTKQKKCIQFEEETFLCIY